MCLEWPPNPNTELLAAATGPRTLQLSGELATGTIVTGGTTPDTLRESLGHINSGLQQRATAGLHSVVVYIVCATGPDAHADALQEMQHWDFDPAQDIAAFGTAADIARAARRWVDAGADTVVLQPAAGADIESFTAFIGSEVQPLLKD